MRGGSVRREHHQHEAGAFLNASSQVDSAHVRVNSDFRDARNVAGAGLGPITCSRTKNPAFSPSPYNDTCCDPRLMESSLGYLDCWNPSRERHDDI